MSVPYRSLGRSGLKVSPLVLGTDNLLNPTPEEESIRMIHAAVAAGINLVDTADSYAGGEAERVVGKALRALGAAADDVLVATKLHYPTGPGPNDRGNSRLHVIRACEGSLRRLGRDHIDLYQTHRPDLEVPLEETLGALDDLVSSGKVRYVGSTTAPAWHLVEALWVADTRRYGRLISEQSPYNLLDRRIENELVPACIRHGLGILCWSPLAMGVLAGRYREREAGAGPTRAAARGGIYAERVTPAAVEIGDRFVALAHERGIDAAQLAALWVKDQPGVTAPIVGPRTVAQLEALVPVMELSLDDATRAACDELVPPGTAVASFFNSAPWMAARRI